MGGVRRHGHVFWIGRASANLPHHSGGRAGKNPKAKLPNEKLELVMVLVVIHDAKVAMKACYCWLPLHDVKK